MNWKLWLGIIISMMFLFLACYKTNISDLKQALFNAKYIYLVPAILLTFLSLWFRAFRWQYIMNPIKHIGVKNLFSATIIGFMVNDLMPARLGEFARAYIIGEKEGISKSSSMGTIVIERIYDGFTVFSFLAVILIFWSFNLPLLLIKALYVTFFMYFFSLIFLIFLKLQTAKVLIILKFIIKPFPQAIKIKTLGILNAFVNGLGILHSGKNIIYSSILSLFVWLPYTIIIYCLLISFGIYLPFYVSLLLLVIICIGFTIPSGPGFIGTLQFLCIIGLAIFSVPKSQALSFSIVYQASQFIPVTFVGLIYFFASGLSFGKMQRSIKFIK